MTGTAEIKTSNGYVALVDSDMAPIVNSVRWFGFKQRGSVYVRKTWRDGKKFRDTKLSHVVAGHPLNGLVVDHINGNPLDNRRANLRIVSIRQNGWNRKERREGKVTSRFVGVSWSTARKKWCAGIGINGKRFALGRFDSEEEAAAAYQAAVRSTDGM